MGEAQTPRLARSREHAGRANHCAWHLKRTRQWAGNRRAPSANIDLEAALSTVQTMTLALLRLRWRPSSAGSRPRSVDERWATTAY